jgi:hypothetical protein
MILVNYQINKYLKELVKQILRNMFWIKEKVLPKFCRITAEAAEVLPKLEKMFVVEKLQDLIEKIILARIGTTGRFIFYKLVK